MGLEVPLFRLGIKTTATKYETRSMQTGNLTPDPEAYLLSATGIPEERMELDEMQLAYPDLSTLSQLVQSGNYLKEGAGSCSCCSC